MTASKERFTSHNEALESVESLQTWINAFQSEYKKHEAAIEADDEALIEMDLHAAVLREKAANIESHRWESENGNLWHDYTDLTKRFNEYKTKYTG